MAIVKNTNSDYVITCKNGDGNLIINANTEVFGNLSCTGSFMTVAAENPGTSNYMGMLAQVALDAWAGLRFNAIQNRWEVSTRVTDDGFPIDPYAPIGLGADGSPSGVNTSIQFNDDGGFGGSANLLFNDSSRSLTLNGYQYYTEQSADAIGVANSYAIFANVPQSGNSGIFVTSPTGDTGELITSKQSLLYSIIF
jgi:hypothetical protein